MCHVGGPELDEAKAAMLARRSVTRDGDVVDGAVRGERATQRLRPRCPRNVLLGGEGETAEWRGGAPWARAYVEKTLFLDIGKVTSLISKCNTFFISTFPPHTR